jgi:aspartyl protease family protein
MGMTFLTATIKKSPESRKGKRLKFLIDTGALYTVAPAQVLRELGIRPHRREEFTLADGSSIERPLGGAYFEHGRMGGVAPVVFGEPGDSNLLGVTTLEAMGVMIDPLTRKLRRLPAMLGEARPVDRKGNKV